MDAFVLADQEAEGLCAGLNATLAYRPSCFFTTVDLGRLDTVVGIRMITTCLSLVGSVTVLVLSLIKRRVLSSDVHPIFMLALADCMLSLLWMSGSAVWLSHHDSYKHVWCYAVTLMTAILECVSVNLTVAYAMFAYINFRRTDLVGSLLWNQVKNEVSMKLSAVVYAVCWLCPTVIIMTVFGFVIGLSNLLPDTKSCSCWCIPSVVNIIPLARTSNNVTEQYVRKQLGFLVGLWSFIFLNYIVAFIALTVMYFKMLMKIRIFRTNYENDLPPLTDTSNSSRVIWAQFRARKRVVLFLTVFIISGFFNAVLTFALAFCSIPIFLEKSPNYLNPHETMQGGFWLTYLSLLYAQSVTLPLQGFLNAIVYGWTREDFVNALDLGQHVVQSSMPDEPCDDSDSSDFDMSLTASYTSVDNASSRGTLRSTQGTLRSTQGTLRSTHSTHIHTMHHSTNKMSDSGGSYCV